MRAWLSWALAIVLAASVVTGAPYIAGSFVAKDGDSMTGNLTMSNSADIIMTASTNLICLNGTTCTDHIYSTNATGYSLRLVGGSGTRSLMSGSWDSTGGIDVYANSGDNAFGVITNGARIDFGAGASDYASSNGTNVNFASGVGGTKLCLNGSAVNCFTESGNQATWGGNNGIEAALFRTTNSTMFSATFAGINLMYASDSNGKWQLHSNISAANAGATGATAAVQVQSANALDSTDYIFSVNDDDAVSMMSITQVGAVGVNGSLTWGTGSTASGILTGTTNYTELLASSAVSVWIAGNNAAASGRASVRIDALNNLNSTDKIAEFTENSGAVVAATVYADGYIASGTPQTMFVTYVNSVIAALTYGGFTAPARDFQVSAVRFRIRTTGSGGSSNATIRISDGVSNCDCAFACNTAAGNQRVACSDDTACDFEASDSMTVSVNSVGDCTVATDIIGNLEFETIWE